MKRWEFIPEVHQYGLAGAIEKLYSARWLVIFSVCTIVLGLIDYFVDFMPHGAYPVMFVGCNLVILGLRIFKQPELDRYNA